MILKKILAVIVILITAVNISLAQDKIEQGKSAINRGDYVAALNILKSAISTDKSYEANYLYGLALLRTGSLAEAEKHFNIALADDDEGVEALIGLGDIYNLKKQYAKANTFYRRGAKIDDENVLVLLSQGRNFSQAGNLDSAVLILTRATTIGKNNADVYTALGDAYFYGRAFPAAIQYYNQSIQTRNNAPAHFGLGRVYYYQKDYQKALDEYKTAVGLDPNFADAYFESGRLLMYNENFAAAEEAFQKYSQLRPGTPLGDIYFARVKIEREKFDEAVNLLNAVITKDANNSSANKYLGYAYLGLEDNSKALDYFSKVPAEDFEAEDYVVLGRLHAASKDMTRALEMFNKAISMDSLESSTYYEMGKVYFENSQYDDAIASFDQAITMGSNQLAAHVYKGIALYQQKKYPEAIISFDEAISKDPTFGFSYLWKGRSQLAMNSKEEARATYMQLLQLEPGNVEAQNDLKLLDGSN